jgi:cation diffusion facilitator family transporter
MVIKTMFNTDVLAETTAQNALHTHKFDTGNKAGEKNTLIVVLLTATMMVFEIAAGWRYNSMALLADGWHMSSHAVALGVSVLAYALARRYSNDSRFTFGTWKIEVLGGYSSALLLAVVAALMMFESVARLVSPREIQFDQAILVASIGLTVNVVSAFLLRHGHHYDHDDDRHDHEHADHHHDINLRAAYLHVIADAATSLLAIVALLGGKYFAAVWLDPMMGIVGAVLVGTWAKGLLFDSGRVLLDAEMDSRMALKVRHTIEQMNGLDLCDLHVWRVGKFAIRLHHQH